MSDLKNRFALAISPEPPFDTELGVALDAAVRGGRRRRLRAAASKTLVVAACAVVVGGAVVAIRPGGSPTPGDGPVVGAASSPSPSATCADAVRAAGLQQLEDASGIPRPGGTTYSVVRGLDKASAPMSIMKAEPAKLAATGAPAAHAASDDCVVEGHNGVVAKRADVPDATLTDLVTAVAAVAGSGRVPMVSPGFATVRADAGTYSVDVTVWAEKFDAQAWTDSCSPSDRDDKPCTVESSSARDLARSTRFTDGSGRASLQYVADAGTDANGDPLTVDVTIDNYVEQHSGEKTVGPTWQDLGFTRTGLRDAIAGTGAFS
jgi:hypothetical protein